MNWVHCNKCYARNTKSTDILFCQCGHLICRACISNKCPICYKNTKYSRLPSRELRPSIDIYFSDPIEYGKRLLSLLKFQFEHRTYLEVQGGKSFQKLKETQNKINTVDKLIQNFEEEVKKEYLRIKKMKMYIEQLEMYQISRKIKIDERNKLDSGIHFSNSLEAFKFDSFL